MTKLSGSCHCFWLRFFIRGISKCRFSQALLEMSMMRAWNASNFECKTVRPCFWSSGWTGSGFQFSDTSPFFTIWTNVALACMKALSLASSNAWSRHEICAMCPGLRGNPSMPWQNFQTFRTLTNTETSRAARVMQHVCSSGHKWMHYGCLHFTLICQIYQRHSWETAEEANFLMWPGSCQDLVQEIAPRAIWKMVQSKNLRHLWTAVGSKARLV